MRKKLFTERMEIRMTKEQAEILRQIAKSLRTTDSEAIRICICDYWEKR